MASTIYIIYNARASLAGKLSYVCRKITTSTPDAPACAACDLTHGGLRLTETPQWSATKRQIGAEVQQLHIDELSPEIIDFANREGIKYPVVLGEAKGGEMQVLLTREDLMGVRGDHGAFLKVLRDRAGEKGVVLADTGGAMVAL